ncbi:MAG: glutamine synthetase [Chloroflexi bacterium]|nr:glutamine synthetase [Chloroflexota bacterium]
MRVLVMSTKEQILAAVKDREISTIDLWFTDITGEVKSVTLPASRLPEVIEHGAHFDGSALDGFARVAESDMLLMPDLRTFLVLPWTSGGGKVARLICSIHTINGDPFVGDPRTVLVNMAQEAREMGYAFVTGMELEFYLFKTDSDGRPILHPPTDQASYFDMSSDPSQAIRREMMSVLAQLNIPVTSTHSEIGHGQHEIDLGHDNVLISADNLLTARVALKHVAARHGLYCTFMPRPLAEMPGSGMHTHQSLHDADSGVNLFANPDDEYGLSDVAKQFLAGQLQHARAMCAVLAPLVNSYKRLGTSVEAPVQVTWAHINRGALIRVPGTSARLELRCPDPSANPYLATAVMLAAGLDGIRNRLALPAPLEETMVSVASKRRQVSSILPRSLGEALEELEQDDILLAALGPYVSDRYLEAKKQEYRDYKRQVTQWELDRYLGRY